MQSTMSPHPSRSDPLPQRRHRKMLKDGSSEVWPQEAEDIFLEGLREYWSSPWANFSRGRSRWRNQYLVDYLKKAGIERSKKQVASHIQVLRNMWKGHPEFTLVAGPDEISESSSTSDRHSPVRGRPSTSPSRRRSSTSASSPPTTPTSFTDAHDGASNSPRSNIRASGMPLSPHVYPLVKTEIPTQSLYDLALPSVPEMGMDPSPILLNRVAGFCLWADGMETNYIDVDALSPLTPPAPTTPNETVHVSLRIKLTMPSTSDIASNMQGFNGAVSFVAPVPPNAKVLTQVSLDNSTHSKEASPFNVVEAQPGPPNNDPTRPPEQRYVAVLPNSWLSRCRWLESGSKKILIIQTVVVDGETLFVVIYDVERAAANSFEQVPRAELVIWHKKFSSTPPRSPVLLPLPISTPSTSRFGEQSNTANAYLYSTAATLQSQAHHVHAPTSTPTSLHHHTPQLQHPLHPLQTHTPSNIFPHHGSAALGTMSVSPVTSYGPSGTLRGKSCAASSSTTHTTPGGIFPSSSDPWTTPLLPLF